MKNEIKGKKQTPVFFKILLGVVGVYLVANFFMGAFFGKGANLEMATANGSRILGMTSAEYAGDMDVMPVGMAEPMMVKSMSAGKVMNDGFIEGSMPIPALVREEIPVPDVDKKIIKNGSIELKVDSAEKVSGEITEIAKRLGGDIFSSNSHRQANGNLRGNLVVKVPVDKFDQGMIMIKESGEQVIFESINGDDVTSEYIDLEARLNNKKAEEETFKKLLNRTGDLSDTLSVTRELTRVRSEIDSLEGQLKYMTSQTVMSTINVTLTEFGQIATDRDSWKPWRTVTSSLHNLILNAQNFVDGLIKFAIVQLPILIVVALLILGAYKVAMKIYRKIRK
jgi:hypothetical protein